MSKFIMLKSIDQYNIVFNVDHIVKIVDCEVGEGEGPESIVYTIDGQGSTIFGSACEILMHKIGT